MQLSLPTNASIANDVVWATIVDNDTVVTDGNASGTIEAAEKAELSVRDVVVDEKAGTATFNLVLGKATTEAFSVAYSTATVAGTATAGADFIAAGGSIGFAAGQTSQSVTVSILDDGTVESDEYFHLALGALSGPGANQVALADGVGTALIGRSDQTALTTPVIAASHLVVNEGDGYAEFVVQLNTPGANPVSVNYAFGSGTADENFSRDFTAIDGTLRFAPGTTTQTVRVDLGTYQGIEPTETFYLNLSNAVNGLIGTSQTTATIIDQSATGPLLAIAPLAADKPEGNTGTTPFTFTVTRTGDISGATSVNWTTGANQSPAATAADFGGTFLVALSTSLQIEAAKSSR